MDKYSQKCSEEYKGYRIYSKPNHGYFSSEYAYGQTSERFYGGYGKTREKALAAGRRAVDKLLAGNALSDSFLLGR